MRRLEKPNSPHGGYMKSRFKQKNKKNRWADHLTQKAKTEKYPARSVYKLMEIQKKFKVIQKNSRILDLGCAPGSWLIYASKIAGPEGKVTGIDLKEIKIQLPANAVFFKGDIFNMESSLDMKSGLAESIGKDYKTVLSDMAPSTTGRKEIDAARSFDLCMAALNCALELLSCGGNFVCKIFQGNDFKRFESEVKKNFMHCNIFKPESCRKASKEIYIIGKTKKN